MSRKTNVKPWLLIGGSGMLGRAWRGVLERAAISYIAPTSQEADFRDLATLQKLLHSDFDTVINCAAYTNVDGAEADEATATLVNGTAVGVLGEACARSGAKLVHYSTDYVFDGCATVPYATNHERNPQNVYGRSKALGEELIERSGCNYLILRTSWLYAAAGNNFVRTIARLASERSQLRVVNDQRGRPTWAVHLADASLRLLRLDASGTYHLTDDGCCTWHEFAVEIVKNSDAKCEVLPCSTEEFPRAAVRPAYSVLDLSTTVSMLGTLPHWHDNLRSAMRSFEATNV